MTEADGGDAATYPCPACRALAGRRSGCTACGRPPDLEAAEVAALDSVIAGLRADVEAARPVFADRIEGLNSTVARRNSLARRVAARRAAELWAPRVGAVPAGPLGAAGWAGVLAAVALGNLVVVWRSPRSPAYPVIAVMVGALAYGSAVVAALGALLTSGGAGVAAAGRSAVAVVVVAALLVPASLVGGVPALRHAANGVLTGVLIVAGGMSHHRFPHRSGVPARRGAGCRRRARRARPAGRATIRTTGGRTRDGRPVRPRRRRSRVDHTVPVGRL